MEIYCRGCRWCNTGCKFNQSIPAWGELNKAIKARFNEIEAILLFLGLVLNGRFIYFTVLPLI